MIVPTSSVALFLQDRHYLGPIGRGFAWSDEYGVMVLTKPTARRLPQDGTWLEIARWCLVGAKNGGSKQWGRVLRHIRASFPSVTTVVSYSDPAVGHTGSLYKACNFVWRPTWHRLKPPPTGNGRWGKSGAISGVKDRWVYAVGPDGRRDEILAVKR